MGRGTRKHVRGMESQQPGCRRVNHDTGHLLRHTTPLTAVVDLVKASAVLMIIVMVTECMLRLRLMFE